MVSFIPDVKDFQRLTKRESCETLGVSDEMLNALINKGLLPPGRRIGKYLFFFGKDIKTCHRRYFQQQ